MDKKRATAIALTYVGAVVGAGFSSGQEIWRFFARHQGRGVFALLVVALFFVVLAPLILLYAKNNDIDNYQHFFYKYLPRPLAILFDFIYSIFLLGSVSVMLAGAGTIFRDLLGITYLLGVSITIVFILATLYLSRDGVIAVNSILIPILLTLTIYTILRYLIMIKAPVGDFLISPFQTNFVWLKDSILYGSYNMIMAIAVMVGITYKEKKENIVLGGILGGFLLVLLCILIYIALISSFYADPQEEIPLLFIASRVGSLIHIFYIITLYFAMLTTAIANYYAFTKRLIVLVKIKYEYALLLSIIFILPLVPSGFSALVDKLYPIFGYLGIFIILVYFCIKFWQKKLK
ncbi:YkvI family membrane protein [Natronospora cellulosivora (SeqCode)]